MEEAVVVVAVAVPSAETLAAVEVEELQRMAPAVAWVGTSPVQDHNVDWKLVVEEGVEVVAVNVAYVG